MPDAVIGDDKVDGHVTGLGGQRVRAYLRGAGERDLVARVELQETVASPTSLTST